MVEPQQGMTSEAQTLLIFFDGLCQPVNPGGYGCGAYRLVFPDGRENRKAQFYGHHPGMTNNIAEYRAAIDGLTTAREAGWSRAVELRGDSQLVIRQFTGQYGVNAEHLRLLLGRLRAAASYFRPVTAIWIPREQNSICDRGSWVAYEAAKAGRLRPKSEMTEKAS